MSLMYKVYNYGYHVHSNLLNDKLKYIKRFHVFIISPILK